MSMSCQDMDTLGIYMDQFPKLDPFMNDDMKDLWDSDLDQVIFFFQIVFFYICWTVISW